eukprot:Platyproteum_vivax@DN5970_c0_g1_i1.p1
MIRLKKKKPVDKEAKMNIYRWAYNVCSFGLEIISHYIIDPKVLAQRLKILKVPKDNQPGRQETEKETPETQVQSPVSERQQTEKETETRMPSPVSKGDRAEADRTEADGLRQRKFQDAEDIPTEEENNKKNMKPIDRKPKQQVSRWAYNMCVAVVMVYRLAVEIWVAGYIGYLSIPVVDNLLSQRQLMNTSFDSLNLVNTYGAFGTVTKKRFEVIFQGTTATNPEDPKAIWREYEFLCKPGRIDRLPCLISPYHYRLDWLMWFAGFGSYEQHPWLLNIAYKFLKNDPLMDTLIKKNPFKGSEPPRFVRAKMFRYNYTSPKETGWFGQKSSNFWRRREAGMYLPVVSLHQGNLLNIVKMQKWDTH